MTDTATLFAARERPAALRGEARSLQELRDSLGVYLACEPGELPPGVHEAARQVLEARDIQGALNATLAMLVAAEAARTLTAKALQDAKDRQKAAETLVEGLEAKMIGALESTGAPGAFTTHHAVTTEPGKPSVRITDKAKLAREFLREKEAPPPEPDKVKLAAALKLAKAGKGPAVEGAELTNGATALRWINKAEG